MLLGPRLRGGDDNRLGVVADFLLPHVSLVRRGIVGWATDHGLATWVWTVNDERVLEALTSDGRIAAVITDVPVRALGLSQRIDLADSRE